MKANLSVAKWGSVAMLALVAAASFHGDARAAWRPSAGSVYTYIATKAFAEGAEKFYLEKIASNEKRAKMIAQAKEDCGGRYESTSVNLIELSHNIDTDKTPSGGTVNYTVAFATDATVRWLVVETIACSMHGGHAQSLLHAALLSGTETETVTYRFVNNRETGSPVVSDVKRAYKMEASELTDQYRVPYPEQ
jgi:hypothetical protein